MVLDYMAGGELFFWLKKDRKFSENRVRLYTAEITLALEALHRADIVYRDLKVRIWPAWKTCLWPCRPSYPGTLTPLSHPARPPQGAHLASLEEPSLALSLLTSRHTNPTASSRPHHLPPQGASLARLEIPLFPCISSHPGTQTQPPRRRCIATSSRRTFCWIQRGTCA